MLYRVWVVVGFTMLVFYTLNPTVASSDTDDYIVSTDKGRVRGHITYESGFEYMSYLGIRYAAPIKSSSRFQPPLPADRWNGIFEATRHVKCPAEGYGDEDCLVVNVFTPMRSHISNGSIPVFVVIHGGSFQFGFGHTEGLAPLVYNDLIVVTMNYRLGALGFLSLGDDFFPGNIGLKDIVAALKWVQTNIASFGGNPEMVTVYGYSSGAVLAELLVLSNSTTGLFRNVILESGSILNFWAIDSDPITTARAISSILNRKAFDTEECLMDFYNSISINKLNEVTTNGYHEMLKYSGIMGFTPCVEVLFNDTQPLITEHPHNILIQQKYNKIPMMIVFSSMEGLNFRGDYLEESVFFEIVDSHLESFIPYDLGFKTKFMKKKVVAEKIRPIYVINNDEKLGYINFFGDLQVTYGVLESAKHHSVNNNVYLVEFAYKGDMGFRSVHTDKYKKAVHADFFKHLIVKNVTLNTEDDIKVVKKVIRLVTNFVKYGNPTPSNSSFLILPALTPKKSMQYLLFDHNMKIMNDPYSERMKLWRELYKSFGIKNLYERPFGPPNLTCSYGLPPGDDQHLERMLRKNNDTHITPVY